MATRQPAEPPAPEQATWTTRQPGAVGAANTVPDVPAGTSASNNDRIIECERQDGSKAFTNAASCSEADFDNRLSYAEPLVKTPERARYSGEGYQPPAEQARNSGQNSRPTQKPNLRLMAKAPPSGLNPSCTFAVGKALEVERALSAADDPMESTWRENYCRWRCDAVERECGVPDSYFYYRYQELCSHEYWNGC
jgi:hypothetical protein